MTTPSRPVHFIASILSLALIHGAFAPQAWARVVSVGAVSAPVGGAAAVAAGSFSSPSNSAAPSLSLSNAGLTASFSALGIAPAPLPQTSAANAAAVTPNSLSAQASAVPAAPAPTAVSKAAPITLATGLRTGSDLEPGSEASSVLSAVAEPSASANVAAATFDGSLLHPKSAAAPLQPSNPAPGSSFVLDRAVKVPSGHGIGVPIYKGTVNGAPAVKLVLPDGRFFVAVLAAKAKSWNEARATARAIQAPGNWDLPTEVEYGLLVMSTALDVKIKILQKTEPWTAEPTRGVYPMWVRSENKADNGEYEGRAVLMAMEDGSGEDFQPVDISAGTLRDMRGYLNELQRKLKAREHRTPSEEKAIAQALNELSAKNGASYNPTVRHEGLPPGINAIITKPSRAALFEAKRNLETMLAAFGNGYPVYSVAEGRSAP